MPEKSAVITVRLSRQDLERIEAVRALENVDRSTLLKEFIEDGLRRRVIYAYQNGRLTASRAAEILRIPLREFLEMLERGCSRQLGFRNSQGLPEGEIRGMTRCPWQSLMRDR